MHGLINRAIEHFARDTYGPALWQAAARGADLDPAHFEAMLHYRDDVTDRALAALAGLLARDRGTVLEDLGTYLVSHPGTKNLRRLLRFGGTDFVEFLQTLEDLPGRTRLAVPDLELPALELHEDGGGRYVIECRAPRSGFGHVLVGLLRALADDYGALACVEHGGTRGRSETIHVTLVEAAFAAGRHFDLGARAE